MKIPPPTRRTPLEIPTCLINHVCVSRGRSRVVWGRSGRQALNNLRGRSGDSHGGRADGDPGLVWGRHGVVGLGSAPWVGLGGGLEWVRVGQWASTPDGLGARR